MTDDPRADEGLVEAMAKAAYLAYCRGEPPESPPAEWWDQDDWDKWLLPERDWDEGHAGTHVGADGFRQCARAALAAARYHGKIQK